MKLILLGAPGAGKGTQAEILGRVNNIPTISTGNILRAAMHAGTQIGLEAKQYVDAGKLVPDDVIVGIVRERVTEADCKNGYILDGMPRTIPQAEALEVHGIKIDNVISIAVSDKEIIERLAGRRICKECGDGYHIEHMPPKIEGKCDKCGGEVIIRKDDEPETVRKRLEIYHEETSPLIEFYKGKGKLISVFSQPEISDTAKMIKEALGQ